jgi:hypothetical protein
MDLLRERERGDAPSQRRPERNRARRQEPFERFTGKQAVNEGGDTTNDTTDPKTQPDNFTGEGLA